MHIFSIGYPVVTLGFGFKSYVGYRMRQVSLQQIYIDLLHLYKYRSNFAMHYCMINIIILIYISLCFTEKTERCSKGERVLSAITAASTASRATSYVDATDPTTSAVTDATCHCIVGTTH